MFSADVQKAINDKAGEIVSLREAWAQAADRAIRSGLSEVSVVEVVRVFHSPASLRKLSESIGKVDPGEHECFLDRLGKSASESDYSTLEWLQALERLLQYLIRNNRSSTINTLLGYLSCSAEYARASSDGLALVDSVEAFLEEFGFDG